MEGTITLVRAADESLVDAYRLYWGVSRSDPVELLGNLPVPGGAGVGLPGGGELTLSVPPGTPVVTTDLATGDSVRRTWILAYSASQHFSSNAQSTGVGLQIGIGNNI